MPTQRIRIALLLGLGVLVNYFDRVNLSVAHDALVSGFHISDVTYGYLLAAYSWTYAAMQLPCGYLLDRFGVRRVMLVATLLWALASGLATIAPSIALLFAARYLLGIGEAPTFPANAKAIGLWFPPERRGVPTATFDAAAKLSIGLGTPGQGLILLRYGLHANFATTTVISLAYFAAFALIYRDPVSTEAIPVRLKSAALVKKISLITLLTQPKVLGVAFGSGAYNFCFYLLLTWLPTYLQRGLKMNPRDAVLWSGAPWLFAAASGFLIGGYLLDTLLRRGYAADTVRRSILIGGTAFGLFIAAPAFLHQPTAILVCFSLALGGLASASPVIWTIPALLTPAAATGRVASIVNLSNQIAGISAPILTGYISSRTHSFTGAFLLAAVILLAGIASYAFLLGRIEPIALPIASTAGPS